jgi:hypothetical protein
MTNPADAVPVLWHYTCEHGNRAIEHTAERAGSVGRGLIRPGLDGWVWATDLDVPVRDALGLTSHSLGCDRTEFRWRLDDLSVEAYFVPWVSARRSVDPVRLDAIEGAPGVMLRHWFVSPVAVWGESA